MLRWRHAELHTHTKKKQIHKWDETENENVKYSDLNKSQILDDARWSNAYAHVWLWKHLRNLYTHWILNTLCDRSHVLIWIVDSYHFASFGAFEWSHPSFKSIGRMTLPVLPFRHLLATMCVRIECDRFTLDRDGDTINCSSVFVILWRARTASVRPPPSPFRWSVNRFSPKWNASQCETSFKIFSRDLTRVQTAPKYGGLWPKKKKNRLVIYSLSAHTAYVGYAMFMMHAIASKEWGIWAHNDVTTLNYINAQINR